MIWSIIPESVIFAGSIESGQIRQICYQGRKVLVRQASSGSGEIVGLISSDPADFLSPKYAPGTLVDLR